LNNVLLIGANGFLGSYLAKTYKVTIATTRFEDPIEEWQQYKNIDTVWLVARACRKTEPRRDRKTKELELKGVCNITETFRHCHFHYTSTKCVYGLTEDDVREISVQHIGNLMCHNTNGISNVPDNDYDTINLKPLGLQHRIYAKTKLACESIIKTTVKSYTIHRIWDIVE